MRIILALSFFLLGSLFGPALAYEAELQALIAAKTKLKTEQAAFAGVSAELEAFLAMVQRSNPESAEGPTADQLAKARTLVEERNAAEARRQKAFAEMQKAASAFQKAFKAGGYEQLIEDANNTADQIQGLGRNPENVRIARRAIARGLARIQRSNVGQHLKLVSQYPGAGQVDVPGESSAAKKIQAEIEKIFSRAGTLKDAIAKLRDEINSRTSEADRKAALAETKKLLENLFGERFVSSLSGERAKAARAFLDKLKLAEGLDAVNELLGILSTSQSLLALLEDREKDLIHEANIERLRNFVSALKFIAGKDPSAGKALEAYLDAVDTIIASISKDAAKISLSAARKNLQIWLVEKGSASQTISPNDWRRGLRSNVLFHQAAPDDEITLSHKVLQPDETLTVTYLKAWFYADREAILLLVPRGTPTANSLSAAASRVFLPAGYVEGTVTLRAPRVQGDYEVRLYIEHAGRKEVTASAAVRVGEGLVGLWQSGGGDLVRISSRYDDDKKADDQKILIESNPATAGLGEEEYRQEYYVDIVRVGTDLSGRGYTVGQRLAVLLKPSPLNIFGGTLNFRYRSAPEKKCQPGIRPEVIQATYVRARPKNRPERDTLNLFYDYHPLSAEDCAQQPSIRRAISLERIPFEALAE